LIFFAGVQGEAKLSSYCLIHTMYNSFTMCKMTCSLVTVAHSLQYDIECVSCCLSKPWAWIYDQSGHFAWVWKYQI